MTVIALVGATILLTRGSILARVRRLWPALLGCSQCAGFWVGAVAGASGVAALGHGPILDAAVAGCAVSILSLVTDAVLVRLLGDPNDVEVEVP